MDNKLKQKIGRELLENMDLTKEQYLQFCALAEDLDLDFPPEPEPEWDELFNE